jgi:hypothetical protein
MFLIENKKDNIIKDIMPKLSSKFDMKNHGVAKLFYEWKLREIM